MEKSKKNYIILTAIIVVSIMIGSFVIAAPPTNGNSALSDLWNRIFGIEEDVEDLQNQLFLMAMIDDLEDRIEDLEDDSGTGTQGPPGPTGPTGPAGPEGTNWLQNPEYDSGWVSAGTGSTIIPHLLGTQELFVYILGRYDSLTHQVRFGTDKFEFEGDFKEWGMSWQTIDDDTLNIYVQLDEYAWEEVRVLIWKLPPPPTPPE